MNIDHRSLLTNYIRHVTACGGTNFLCRIGDRRVAVTFTDDEIAELQAIEKEASAMASGTEYAD
jgi:hypothetical protein